MKPLVYGNQMQPRDKPEKPNPVHPPTVQTTITKHGGSASQGYLQEGTAGLAPYKPKTRQLDVDSDKIRKARVGQLLITERLAPAQITAAQNNYEPDGFLGAGMILLNSNASQNITGFGRDGAGHVKIVVNIGAQNIVLVHESGSSTANKRLNLKSGANFTLSPGAAIWLVYDSTSDRWRLIGS